MFDLLFKEECCHIDKSLSSGGLYFGILVAVATIVLLFLFSRQNKKFLRHYFTVMIAVFMFEAFTSPMWDNAHFGKFAYLYQDVSWVLTFGWSTLILSIVLLIDSIFRKTSNFKRFFLYLLGMCIFGFLAESMVLYLGLRTYSPEVINSLSGLYFGLAPIETFYYIPVFSALIIAFYKYWSQAIEGIPLVPEKKIKWGKSLMLSVIAVFLFELIVEPMVINADLPQWSYVYKDISIILTGIWVLIIWMATKLVDKYFIQFNLQQKFGLYLLAGSVIAVPLEFFYFSYGFRVYGASAVRDFSGISTPVLDLPVEILFAMPMYFALMIAFIKFGELTFRKK